MDIEKPNCIGCHHIHPDNGNCTAVGGFCTAVPAANCPLIPELRAENEKMRAELEQKSKLIAQEAAELERRDTLLKDQEAELERVKRERDAAVDCCSGYCASCLFVKDCGKHEMNDAAQTRWYYGDCEAWEWRGWRQD